MIKQWTRDKGLVFGTESERQTFSYFTARKIARLGTKRNTQHVEVYSLAMENARKEIENDIRALISTEITTATANF